MVLKLDALNKSQEVYMTAKVEQAREL